MSQNEALVTCHDCGHTWLYRGVTPYAQCPNCQLSNNLNDDTIKSEQVA